MERVNRRGASLATVLIVVVAFAFTVHPGFAEVGGVAQSAKSPLGLSVETVTPALAHELGLAEHHGVFVEAVEDASPAAAAGLLSGDVVLTVDRHRVRAVRDLKRLLVARGSSSPIRMRIDRRGREPFVIVVPR